MCEKHDYLRPLHDEKGGPHCCLTCIGKWQGEHGRKRRTGRIAIRALMAFKDAGGSYKDIDKLTDCAKFAGMEGLFRDDLTEITDQLGYMDGIARLDGSNADLTSELLADALRLVHPDHHPAERRELAHRVTQGLLALQPFVFPAPKPKPVPVPEGPPSAYTKSTPEPKPKSSSPRYPCADCADAIPHDYCDACRAEYEKRRQKEFVQRTAKQRAEYKRRRERKLYHRPQRLCEVCGNEFKRARTDARFCSDTCRQRAHRKAVTDRSNSHGLLTSNRYNGALERGILALLERHPAVFLNDLLPKERTRAQYQTLVLAAIKLEDVGRIGSFSYAWRWGKPGHKVLLRRGHQINGSLLPAQVHRLTAQERRAFVNLEHHRD
jgi:predicted nucleic acid-binding Zn ribbon protein